MRQLRALVKATLNEGLSLLGLRVRRLPRPLAFNPHALLRIDLPMVVSHHLASRKQRAFFFVQIGAFDGRSGDPLHQLVVANRWEGVLVEPQRDAFMRLQETYRSQPQLRLRNVAVGPRTERRQLFRIAAKRPGLPEWSTQVASFQLETIRAHRREIPDIDELIEATEIECQTFDDLLPPPMPRHLDLLQIDAEGFDDEILRLFHASGRTASIVAFEHKHLSRLRLEACFADLIARGYQLALDGPDTVGYRAEGMTSAPDTDNENRRSTRSRP